MKFTAIFWFLLLTILCQVTNAELNIDEIIAFERFDDDGAAAAAAVASFDFFKFDSERKPCESIAISAPEAVKISGDQDQAKNTNSDERKPCKSITIGNATAGSVQIYGTQENLWDNYKQFKFQNQLIYIDTRDHRGDPKTIENKSQILRMAKTLGDRIEEKGLVLSIRDSVLESRKALNYLLPKHKYSYTDGPFLVGHVNVSEGDKNLKDNEFVIDFSGMNSECLATYFDDIEQAIVRGQLDDLETTDRWSKNSALCEAGLVTKEKYGDSLKRIVQYFKGFMQNHSSQGVRLIQTR